MKEQGKNRQIKKITIGFAVFLILMLVCTVISKSVYAYQLPMVSTLSPEEKYVEHSVEAEGIVIAGGERAVTYFPNLRIDSVLVHVGDRVEEGDELLRIDLEELKEFMEEKQDEISKVSMRIDAILENQAIEQQKKDLELARAREDYDTTARLEDTYVGRAAENYVQAEEDLEELEGLGGSSEDDALKDALQNAAYGEADAKAERDEAVKQAGRKVEDILMPDQVSSDLDVAKLEKETLLSQLGEYQQILDTEGIVRAPFGGVVTDVAASAGGRVPDTAVVLISDESLPCQLKVFLDKEQKKYIGLGDSVSIKLEGKSSKLDGTIDYLSESRSLPGSYEALINLPEDTGIPGISGTVSRTESGEKYRLCIPPSVIYQRNDSSFVYVLKEREGILGQEYYVDEAVVKVLDQNESWAAVEDGILTKDSEVIASSTKEITKGDVVRWEEE
ncbi:MAG: HlyD family efflux transporter periplasmic adaptor subunit [Lachnospiraceae bacterium]|nr:HlyD family efflux transporter periplasmic adaptor subunit [Lachnospiraceae bacterium]